MSPVVGMTQLDGREVVVTNKTANTFEMYDSDGNAVNTTGYGAFVSGVMAEIVEVVSPYLESEVHDLRVTQSADTLYITHPDYEPRKLTRTSPTSWALAVIPFYDGPYLAQSSSEAGDAGLNFAGTSGTVAVTATGTGGINSGQGFLATDVGRALRVRNSATNAWTYTRVTDFTDSTHVNVYAYGAVNSSTTQLNWRLGVWSDTTGFPRCSTFYEDRLFFAGAALYPQRLDGSKSGLYENFSPSAADGTVADDNAVAFTLNADEVNAIRWLSPNEKGLLAGTTRSEWQVKASSLNEALTPTNISAKPSTRYGSALVAPVSAGKVVLFVQRSSRKLRELAYVFEVDGFKAPDMTVLAEHITRTNITEVAYQEQPQAIVWGVRGDGVLLGMTYDRDQDVVAWHRHVLGGRSTVDGAAPIVESVAVTASPDGARDEVALIVKRYINGGTKRYVEYVTKMWEDGDEQVDAFYADCGRAIVNASPSTSVTGLWHLEGEDVGVYVDGAVHPGATVTNGAITLSYAGTKVTVGYHYNSDGQTLPWEGGAQDGSAQGKTKRVSRLGFWLVDALGLEYGPDADHLTELLQRQWGDEFGDPASLFTGVIRAPFEGVYDRTGQVYWRASGPFPATISAVMPQGSVSDDS